MGNKVRNTTEIDPLELMVDALAGDSIERQEARGQQELVNSDVLPKPSAFDPEVKTTLEEMGVVFGDDVEGDPLFVNVMLPAGWKKVATDHSMWSDLQDETGKVVANIFYKAAFYDRKADLYLARK